MRELLVRLEYKRRNYRKRVRAHFTGGDRRFFGIAGLILLMSFTQPAGFGWYLGETAGLVVIALLLAATIVLIPVALVIL